MLYNCQHCKTRLNIKYARGYQFRPKICSASCFASWLESTNHPKLIENELVSFIKNTDVAKEFKSRYEIMMSKILDSLGIEYVYEKYIALLKIPESNKKKVYIPDFYLPKYNCFLEVKGLWMVGAYQKVKALAKIYPIYLITREDISILRR